MEGWAIQWSMFSHGTCSLMVHAPLTLLLGPVLVGYLAQQARATIEPDHPLGGQVAI